MTTATIPPPARRPTAPAADSLRRMLAAARPRRVRSLLEFAGDEVGVPDGPHPGRLRAHHQPATWLWLAAVSAALASRRYRRFVAVAPVQSGKTLCASIVPLMFHLFELGQDVGFALTDIEMAADKWAKDIRPVIERSRYRRLMPTTGPSSRGGRRVMSLTFGHGRVLRFFGAGGGLGQLAGYTVPVMVMTEVDKYAVFADGSAEADKVRQLENRTRAYGDAATVYMECTTTTTTGRIWSEYQAGTRGLVVMRCPSCRAYVCPERDHLTGWADAADELAAEDATRLVCPSCGAGWDDATRTAAVADSRILYDGQAIDSEGVVTGRARPTRTLSVRWNAAVNRFVPVAALGRLEWLAVRSEDDESAQREISQLTWATPTEPDVRVSSPLDSTVLTRRVALAGRGEVPAGTVAMTVGIDLGKWVAHYAVVAWGPRGAGHIMDYGTLDVPSGDRPTEDALVAALREFRDTTLMAGWLAQDGGRRVPDQVWIDSGYWPAAVYTVCRDPDSNPDGQGPARFRPVKGFGATQRVNPRYYHAPPGRTRSIIHIGDGYHMARMTAERVLLVHLDVDTWKSRTHARLAVPLDVTADDGWTAGGLSLFSSPDRNEHVSFVKHLTSEQQVVEVVPGRGEVATWKQVGRRANHWLDATVYAAAAGHLAGVGTESTPATEAATAATHITHTATGPDGRPYRVTPR